MTTTEASESESGQGHRPRRTGRHRWIVGGVVAGGVALIALVAVGLAVALSGDGDGPDLDPVRDATAAFHDLPTAESAGYAPLLECFDDPAGGMGQHYVNQALLEDPAVDPVAPEALVYEVTDGGLELVGVEYIRPQAAGGPPELFGRTFHANDELGLWVLHAWAGVTTRPGSSRTGTPTSQPARGPRPRPVAGLDRPNATAHAVKRRP